MAGFSYFPHTDDDIRVMLERVGVHSLDDLYSDVPADFIYKGEYDLPAAMSEQEVRDFFEGLGKKNTQLVTSAFAAGLLTAATGRDVSIVSAIPMMAEYGIKIV